MNNESPIQHAALALIADAAAQPTWLLALKRLGLAPTDENVRAFKERATVLGVDYARVRWRRNWDEISPDELRLAVDGARNRTEVLGRLGLKAGGTTYIRLEGLSEQMQIQLPPRLRRGPVPWPRQPFACSDEEVRAAFSDARSMADLLRRVGLVPRGDNYRVMRRRLTAMGLDPKNLSGQGWAAGRTLSRLSLDEILVRGKKFDGPRLAQRLIDAGLLVRQCAMCLLTQWLGKPIPLELDHINGEHDDNRLENLRLLCPTCHALTPTYRGRNVGRRRMDAQARVLERFTAAP